VGLKEPVLSAPPEAGIRMQGATKCSEFSVQGRKSEEHPPTLTSFAEGYGGQEATEDRESEEQRAKRG